MALQVAGPLNRKIRHYLKQKPKVFNVYEGAVRSGKTIQSLIEFMAYVLTHRNENCNFLMTGQTIGTIKKNLLDGEYGLLEMYPMFKFIDKSGDETLTFRGITVYLVGAHDASSYKKIRGLTILGWYSDEVNLCPRSFIVEALNRSIRSYDRQNIWTLNPDVKGHWIYTDFIDKWRKLSPELINYFHFILSDNPVMEESDIELARKTMTPANFKRYVLGLRGSNEGSIYKHFNSDCIIHSFDRLNVSYAIIGTDYGKNKSANAFVLVGFVIKNNTFTDVICLDEYYSPGTTPLDTLEKDYVSFVNKCKAQYPKLAQTYGETAEPRINEKLRLSVSSSIVRFNSYPKARIIDRIRWVDTLMFTGRFKVMSKCKHLIQALNTAQYKDNERLDDGTTNIDSLDAMEYAITPYAGKQYLNL